jgi:uncharacterized membrane protein
MFNFFDYFYYRVCNFYTRSGDSGARIGALCIVSLFQLFNVFSIFVLTALAITGFVKFGKAVGILLAVGILIYNGFRYNRLNFDVLNEKWQGEGWRSQRKKKLLIFIYMIVSILLVILLIFRNLP